MFHNLAQLVILAVTRRQVKIIHRPRKFIPGHQGRRTSCGWPTGHHGDRYRRARARARPVTIPHSGTCWQCDLIKAVSQVGPLEAMVYVWHQSGWKYGTGRGDLLKADGTTIRSDRTKEGCVVMLFVTPEAYDRMDQSTLQRVYPPRTRSFPVRAGTQLGHSKR